MPTKAEVLKVHHERIARLMATTRVDSDTSFDVIDEAALHLMEHFDPKDGNKYKNDHVLIIGSAFFGQDVNDPATPVDANMCFMGGDMHALSHSLAHTMRTDETFKAIMIHAIEVYNSGQRKREI